MMLFAIYLCSTFIYSCCYLYQFAYDIMWACVLLLNFLVVYGYQGKAIGKGRICGTWAPELAAKRYVLVYVCAHCL
jgi:hypothetical protein